MFAVSATSVFAVTLQCLVTRWKISIAPIRSKCSLYYVIVALQKLICKKQILGMRNYKNIPAEVSFSAVWKPILQANSKVVVFVEIYKICALLHRLNSCTFPNSKVAAFYITINLHNIVEVSEFHSGKRLLMFR